MDAAIAKAISESGANSVKHMGAVVKAPSRPWKARPLTARRSAIACATASRNWAENSLPSFCMPLPETIAIRFTEDDAGYVTVRPVVRQTFVLPSLRTWS